MSRTAINFLVDALLFLTFNLLLLVTAVLGFVFPPATRAAGWTLWGRTYDEWQRAQFGCLAALALGVLLHLVLHWTWVCGFVTSRVCRWTGRTFRTTESTRTHYGVTTLIAVLTGLLLVLFFAQLALKRPHATSLPRPRPPRAKGKLPCPGLRDDDMIQMEGRPADAAAYRPQSGMRPAFKGRGCDVESVLFSRVRGRCGGDGYDLRHGPGGGARRVRPTRLGRSARRCAAP